MLSQTLAERIVHYVIAGALRKIFMKVQEVIIEPFQCFLLIKTFKYLDTQLRFKLYAS